MIPRLASPLARFARRFARDEAGNTNTIAFAIWTPILLLTLGTAMEVGVYTARATLLERGMDMAARDIRLDTGLPMQHDDIKAAICEEARIIPHCTDALRLEMIPQDMHNWTNPPSAADCTDRARPVSPLRSFVPGQSNEMMILRACTKVTPILPMTWLSGALQTDAAGDFAIVTTSAFVQEPR
jgi:hypothetical protein